MSLSNSDFWILAGILSGIGGLGVYVGYELHPVFYSQSAMLFGTVGYLGYKVFYADKKEKELTSVDSGIHGVVWKSNHLTE